MVTRRSLLAAGAGLVGSALAASPAFAQAMGGRALSFTNLHTGETLTAEYWQGGAYAPDALAAIDHVLRDHRTGDVHPIDPRLLDLLHDLSAALEARNPFQVISGYRSPQSNAALADASSGVARGSLHMQGMAIDVALAHAPLPLLRQAALDLGRGGVGYYPDPGFVHVDVGRVRRW
jgi:uncharacterized protein YcbK (DUF882 family)